MTRRVLLVIGHPRAASYCHALAEAYASGANQAGHELRRLDLAGAEFDPVLHVGYSSAMPLEAILVEAKEAITWADHLVFVYPTWWGGLPAVLKGFIDRVFLPGFAFKYREDSIWWDKLLKGRSAQLLVTMDTPPFYYKWMYRAPGHNQMKKTVLEFCGIAPVRIATYGSIKTSTDAKRAKWLAEAQAIGAALR